MKPNDFGLFDNHGNVWNWCHNAYENYPQEKDGFVKDDANDIKVDMSLPRVLRGGAVINEMLSARSAYRNLCIEPTVSRNYIGFRPARTVKP